MSSRATHEKSTPSVKPMSGAGTMRAHILSLVGPPPQVEPAPGPRTPARFDGETAVC
jgi:hypothetical protein